MLVRLCVPFLEALPPMSFTPHLLRSLSGGSYVSNPRTRYISMITTLALQSTLFAHSLLKLLETAGT